MEKSYRWQNTNELLQLQILEGLLNQYNFDIRNKNINPFQNLDQAFKEIIELLKIQSSIKPKQDYYQPIDVLLTEITKFTKEILPNWNETENFNLKEENQFKRFSNFLKDYKYLITQFRLISPQLSFNKLGVFCELSSGEQMLLKMYGKLWNALTSLNEQNWDIQNKSILIMLDEADLTLHPEWQRSLLQKLKYSLNTFFKDFNIQLILTSHSPFLVSDLPRENIIFLAKEENELPDHTFGANIHSLYRNSFFLENGLMGEFAKGKINDIIKYIINPKSKFSKKKLKECRFIIEQIGEPVLRNKLEKLLDDKIKQTKKKDELKKYYQERLLELDQ